MLKAESWNVAEVPPGAVLPFKALTRSFGVEPCSKTTKIAETGFNRGHEEYNRDWSEDCQ